MTFNEALSRAAARHGMTLSNQTGIVETVAS